MSPFDGYRIILSLSWKKNAVFHSQKGLVQLHSDETI
jgi:hypothetical protein